VDALLITGMLKTDRIREAVAALKIELTNEQWYRILIALQGHPMA
jgi:predicted oxidoreductase